MAVVSFVWVQPALGCFGDTDPITIAPSGTGTFTVWCSEECVALVGVSVQDTNLATVSPVNIQVGPAAVTFTVTATNQTGSTTIRVAWSCDPVGSGSWTIPLTVKAASTSGPGGSAVNYNDSGEDGDPVNTYTGELVVQAPADLDLGDFRPLFFSRYYASGLKQLSNISGRLGDNWRHNFEMALTKSDNTVEIIDSRGRLSNFEKSGSTWNLTGSSDIPYQLVESLSDFILGDPQTKCLYTFNEDGRLTRIEDGPGNVQILTYTSFGILSQVADNLGRTLSFTYSTTGKLTGVSDGIRSVMFIYTADNLTGVTDPLGNTTTYSYDTSHTISGLMTACTLAQGNTPYLMTYDSDGRVATQRTADISTYTFNYSNNITTITDPLGNVRQHTHSSTGELTSHQDEAGNSVTFGSDSTGRRTLITNRQGGSTSRTYHAASGLIASETNELGQQTSYTYASRTHSSGIVFYDLSSITYADNTTELFSYDSSGNLTSWTDQGGNAWTFTYNGNGQALTATNPEGGVFTFTYDASGNLWTSQDNAGNVTTYSYDSLNRRTWITRADSTWRSFTYDNLDRRISVTDELGSTTVITYDNNGNQTSAADPLNNTVTYVYDLMDRLAAITDAMSESSSATYDELGRMSTRTDREGNTTGNSYDAVGNMIQTTDPDSNVWNHAFNVDGWITSITDPLLNTFIVGYDAARQITSATSPLFNTTWFTYNSVGLLTGMTDPTGHTLFIDYDARGLVSKASVAGGSIFSGYTRNGLGQITAATDPNGKPWQVSFDAQGRIISKTDPLRNTSAYASDSRNRLSTLTFPSNMGTMDVTYDNNSNITQRLFSDNTVLDYTYDANNLRLTANNVTFSYDSRNDLVSSNGLPIQRDQEKRIQSVTMASGKTITYTYNSRGLLSSLSDWIGESMTFTYDSAGRLVSAARSNGVNTTVTYDNDNNITGISEAGLSSITLTRDASGRVSQANRSVPMEPVLIPRTDTFEYDAGSQVGNYIYDAMGRLVNDGARIYTWDLASRLTRYTEGGGTVNLTYDGFGMVLTRNAWEYVWTYAFDFASISVVRQSGQDIRYYVHTPDGRLLYSMEAGDSSRRFYHFDEMGSTMFLTDDNGTVTDSYNYTPYGALAVSSGTTDNPFTYIGCYGVMQEGTSGLYRMRKRIYDSTTARFISREPIPDQVHPLTINPYAYAAGNPLRFIDPNGEDPQSGSSDASAAAGVTGNVLSVLGETLKQTASEATDGLKKAGNKLGAVGTVIGALSEVGNSNERMKEVCRSSSAQAARWRDEYDRKLRELHQDFKDKKISSTEYNKRRKELGKELKEQIDEVEKKLDSDTYEQAKIVTKNLIINLIPGGGFIFN